MMLNEETGAIQCDRCAKELEAPVGVNEYGENLCEGCVEWWRGHAEGQRDLHREFLRFAVFGAINDRKVDWVRRELASLMDEAEAILERRRAVGAPTYLSAEDSR